MASRKAPLVAAAAMAVVVGALLPATAFPNSHLVGDLDGWRLGVNYTVCAWNNDPIPVGDTLEFRYTAGDHTVVKVEEDGYNNCDVNNNIGFWDDGDDFVQLPEVGKYFFICGTGNHYQTDVIRWIAHVPRRLGVISSALGAACIASFRSRLSSAHD